LLTRRVIPVEKAGAILDNFHRGRANSHGCAAESIDSHKENKARPRFCIGF